jgi:hypothetical protein
VPWAASVECLLAYLSTYLPFLPSLHPSIPQYRLAAACDVVLPIQVAGQSYRPVRWRLQIWRFAIELLGSLTVSSSDKKQL